MNGDKEGWKDGRRNGGQKKEGRVDGRNGGRKGRDERVNQTRK